MMQGGDQKDRLKKSISMLSEDNFKVFIQEYNKLKYKTSHVRIIDGPYDGGNDLEVILADQKDIKRNIQITVQQSNFEKKVDGDLKKAKENVDKYKYQNILDFYISHNISPEKKNEQILHAEVEYGITLNILDSSFLADQISALPTLKEILYDLHDIKIETEPVKSDEQSRLLYDVLTHNKDTVEIKKNFLISYLYSFLYGNPDSSVNEIYDNIKTKLNSDLDKDFLVKELNYLRSKQILVSPSDKTHFTLSNEKRVEIGQIYQETLQQENDLLRIVQEFITKNQLNTDPPALIDFLKKIYFENYSVDIGEVTNQNNSFGASMKRTFNDLQSFFVNQGIEIEHAKELTKEIIRECADSDYLNKLSVTSLFTNLYSSNKLEKYLNDKMQKMIMDTQILIRVFCILYNEDYEHSDAALTSVKILWKTLERYKTNIQLITTDNYVQETAAHIQEALKLERFLELPMLEKLGNSKNVFYNLYITFRKDKIIDPKFRFVDFIESLIGEKIRHQDGEEQLYKITRKLSIMLELLDVQVINHQSYTKYEDVKRTYEMELSYMGKAKLRSLSARNNDIRTILFLSDKDIHTDSNTGEVNEPFLITWDSVFYTIRRKMLEKQNGYNYWYIYSPLKIVDRLSVRNFKLNPRAISYNIIALAETNFNYSTKTTSFFDVISSFFNKEDVSKLGIINKLADLRKSTQDLDETNEVPEFSEKEEPITKTLITLKNHYYSYEAKYNMDDLVALFETTSLENQIIEILKTSVDSSNYDEMYLSFDYLIGKTKEVSK